ncbi:15567_t:CDS:2, partial [Racocetra persica]
SAVKKYNIKEIPYKAFSNKKKIKRGGFGIVFRVKCESLGDVVIKEVADTDVDEQNRKIFINELKQHSRANHPRIIQFHGITMDKDEEIHFLALEYANNGNLRQYLKELKPGWLEKIRLTTQIAEGMCYLHSINIIHRDLKDIKISDFGFSRKLDCMMNTNSKHLYGVIPFVDPQKLKNFQYKCDQKSDIYSIGVLMWEVSSDGQIPFAQENYSTLAISIIQGLREKPVSGTPMHYISLYSGCWNNEPHKRPSVVEIFRQLETLELDPKYKDTELKENNSSDFKSVDIDGEIYKTKGSRDLEFRIN